MAETNETQRTSPSEEDKQQQEEAIAQNKGTQLVNDDKKAATTTTTTTTAVQQQQEEDREKPQQKTVKELIDQGNQALALGKYEESTEHFSYAVEQLIEKHGEMSIETVDALELYGNALVRNAVSKSAVLGGEAAASKVPTAEGTPVPSTSSSSKPGPSNGGGPLTTDNIRFHFGGDGEEEDEEEQEGGDEDEEGGEGEEEEEDDEFETAYQILDSARVILTKYSENASSDGDGDGDEEKKKARKLQLARIHCSLAEIATETSQFEDAVKEYETALAIQQSELAGWDRLLSQTHFFLATTLEMLPSNTFDDAQEEQRVKEHSYNEAIRHVQRSKEILRNRQLYLKGLYVEGSSSSGGKDESDALQDGKGKGKARELDQRQSLPAAATTTTTSTSTAEDAEQPKRELSEKDKEEIKDIDLLQGDLDLKIEELQAQLEEARQQVGSLQEQLSVSTSKLPDNVSKEVHNLNSLVKKKPKKDPSGSGAATNGTSTAPGSTSAASAVGVTNGSTNAAPAIPTTITVDPSVSVKRKAEDHLVRPTDDNGREGEAAEVAHETATTADKRTKIDLE